MICNKPAAVDKWTQEYLSTRGHSKRHVKQGAMDLLFNQSAFGMDQWETG